MRADELLDKGDLDGAATWRRVIKAIEEARSHGDLSENAEYHAARDKQSFIEGRLASTTEGIAALKAGGLEVQPLQSYFSGSF